MRVYAIFWAITNTPYKMQLQKEYSIKDTKVPSWVLDFGKRLHFPEKKIIFRRLIEDPNMVWVFEEIDEKLPSYEIKVYDEIAQKLPPSKIPTKADILVAIACVYKETKAKFSPHITPGKRDILDCIKNIFTTVHAHYFPHILTTKGIIDELRKIGPEIDENLDKRIGRDSILAAIINGGVCCNPQKPVSDLKGNPSLFFLSTKEIREDLKRHKELRDEISETATKLIELLDSYESIQEKGIITSEADFDIFHLIKRAAKNAQEGVRYRGHFLYEHYVEPHIEKASSFGCDYYPSLQDILTILALEVIVNDSCFVKAEVDWRKVLQTRQASTSDFVRYLLAFIEEKKGCHYLPDDFELSNSAIVKITECVLDLPGGLSEDNIRKIKKKMRAENF